MRYTRGRILSSSVIAAALLSLLACIAWLDRPIADFAHERFFGTRLFEMAAAVFLPARMVLAAIALFAAGCGIWRVAGREIPESARPPFAAALAGVVALVAALALKFAIGRSQVYPPYLVHHVFEVRPFRGGVDQAAFPSATIAIASAVAAVLSTGSARRRIAGGAIVILLAACLIITNGHWLSDILGGLYLGVLIGKSTPRMLTSRFSAQ